MDQLKYLDFDVLIERANEGYRVRVLQSPAGQASAEFTLPFTDQDIEILMLRVGRSRRGVRRVESPEMQAAKQFGGKLFDSVFAGDVRGALRSSLDEANRQGAGLRMRLRLADAPELVDLPWEFLYNASLNRFLALSNKTPLVRYIELPESPRPLKIAPPLRILVMISSPTDYDRLDVEREWQKLNDALRDLVANNSVTLERLDTATLGALRRKLRQGQYHALHFIGHGGFDAQTQDGLLILEDEQGRGRRTSGQYLAQVLTDHDSMRLVVLNACEGARTARTDPFAGVAQSLVQQGIPAVIAMQFEITDEASIAFTHEFYGAIADGYPIDAALGGARSAIFTDVNDLEWGTPVLYLRAPDGLIFATQSKPKPQVEQAQPAPESVQDRQAEEQRARERAQLLETLYLAAQISFAENDFDTAEKSVASLLAEDPANANARDLQNKIKESRANQVVAQQRAQEASERQQQIETLYRAAQSNFDKNDFDAAEKSLAALFALDAANEKARALEAKLPQARERRAQVERLVRQAQIQLEQQRFDAAARTVDEILERDNDNAQARALESQIALARQHLADEQAGRERQEQIQTLSRRADAALAKNDLDAAETALAALVALDANNAHAGELSEKIRAAREQAARARQERERAGQVEKLLAEAQTAFASRNFDAADKALAALFVLDPSNANARAVQQQIRDARKRAVPTPVTSAERIFAPPGVPERATTKSVPSTNVSSGRSYGGIPARSALLVAGIIIAGLLLFGSLFAFGILNRNQEETASATPALRTGVATPAQAASDDNSTRIAQPTAKPSQGAQSVPAAAEVTATATDAVNIRQGPARTTPSLAKLQPNTRVRVTGRNADGTWIQIQIPDTTNLGWVSAEFLKIQGDLGSVPVVVTLTATPPSVQAAASPQSTRVPTPTERADLFILPDKISQLKPLRQLSGITQIVRTLDFSPDSQQIAAGSGNAGDFNVRIWDVASGELVKTLATQGIVWDIRFSRDGKRIGAAPDETFLYVWDLPRGVLSKLALENNGRPTSLDFSPDNSEIAVGGLAPNQGGVMWLLRSADGKSLARYKADRVNTQNVHFLPDGTRVVEGAIDRVARILDGRDGTVVRSLQLPGQGYSLALSPDGENVAIGICTKSGTFGCDAGQVWLWRVSDGQVALKFNAPDGAVDSVNFSANGEIVAAAGGVSQELLMWRVADGKPIGALPAQNGKPRTLAFSPDGRYLAVGESDDSIWLWGIAP